MRNLVRASAVVVMALTPAAAAPAVAAPRPEFFSPTGVWNRPLAPGQAVAPNSSRVVAELIRQMDDYGGPWMNIEEYSVPVYRVGPRQRRVRVRDSDGGSPRPGSPFRWSTAPVPPRATAAAGTDRHLVVWQPATDTMWEFWGFARTASGAPTARHGARIPRVSRNPGIIEAPYGATASGLPAAAGIVTARDVARGRIDHALAIAVPEPRREVLTLPATRTDGWSASADAPMEGARFRLDPRLDIGALRLHPFVRMLAVAAQRYGIVVRDKAGAVVFFGEDPRGVGRDPFARLLAGRDRRALLRTFPWGRLQMLPVRPFCCWQNWDYRTPASAR